MKVAVRADDEHAAPGVLLALRCRSATRRGAARRRSCRCPGRPGSTSGRSGARVISAVLVGLDRRDDVAHVRCRGCGRAPRAGSRHAGDVERRAVERLVGDVEQPAALRPEAAAQRHALRILRRRRVERSCGGRLPVDDHLLAFVVVHPAAADVERALDGLEVETAEQQSRARRPRTSRAASPPRRRAPPARPRRRPRRRRRSTTSRMRSRHAYARSTYACSAASSGWLMGRAYASRQGRSMTLCSCNTSARFDPRNRAVDEELVLQEHKVRSQARRPRFGPKDVSRRGAALGPPERSDL